MKRLVYVTVGCLLLGSIIHAGPLHNAARANDVAAAAALPLTTVLLNEVAEVAVELARLITPHYQRYNLCIRALDGHYDYPHQLLDLPGATPMKLRLTPLMVACLYGSVAMAHWLIAHGADYDLKVPQLTEWGCLYEVPRTYRCMDALECALRSGSEEIVAALISEGVIPMWAELDVDENHMDEDDEPVVRFNGKYLLLACMMHPAKTIALIDILTHPEHREDDEMSDEEIEASVADTRTMVGEFGLDYVLPFMPAEERAALDNAVHHMHVRGNAIEAHLAPPAPLALHVPALAPFGALQGVGTPLTRVFTPSGSRDGADDFSDAGSVSGSVSPLSVHDATQL